MSSRSDGARLQNGAGYRSSEEGGGASPRPARDRPRWRTRVSALLVSLVLTLGVSEIAARAYFSPPQYAKNMRLDPELGFRPLPTQRGQYMDIRGHFTSEYNSLGYRGPELPVVARHPDDGKVRILFCGDSFLASLPVRYDSLMPYSAERLLRERGIDAECFNTAVSAYGTGQELTLLRRYGPRLQPDVVVLAVFTGNDFDNNCLNLSGRLRSDGLSYIRPWFTLDESGRARRTWLYPVRTKLRHTSRLFQLAELRLLAAGILTTSPARGQGPRGHDERIAAGLVPRPYMNLFREEPEDGWEQTWQVMGALLREFRDETESLGARLLVVVIPSKFQVQHDAAYALLDSNVEKAWGEPLDEHLDWNRPERRLAEFLESEDISALVLLDPLRQETLRTSKTAYVSDGHLNWRGHELAGELVSGLIADALAGHPQRPKGPTGTPVDVIALAYAKNGVIDFGEGIHPELFPGVFLPGRDWISWRIDWGDGAGPGWAMRRTGTVALPGHGGELVVRGWLPRSAGVPLSVKVHGVDHTIHETGHFELRQEIGESPDPTATRLVRIATSGTWPLDDVQVGLILQGLGVLTPRSGD